jgi:hypothetical protein
LADLKIGHYKVGDGCRRPDLNRDCRFRKPA